MQRTCCLCLFLAFVWAFSASASRAPLSEPDLKLLDATYDQVQDSYPGRRRWESGVEFLAGMATLGGATSLFFNPNLPNDEAVVQVLGLGFGAALALDGFSSFFNPTAIEEVTIHYRALPATGEQAAYGGKTRIEYGESSLEYYAQHARIARFARSGLYLATSLCYLYLYSKGTQDYRTMIFPGAIFAGVAAYYLIFRSPTENAWDDYQARKKGEKTAREPSSVHLWVGPNVSGASLGFSLAF